MTNLPPLDMPGLSDHQIRILRLASTMSAKQVAAELNISMSAVYGAIRSAQIKHKDMLDKKRLEDAWKGVPRAIFRSPYGI